MKLLGWMHRKFRQNSSEPLKDFAIGQPPPNKRNKWSKTTYGIKPCRQTQKVNLRKSFAGIEAIQVEESHQEETSAAMSELFQGFLSIGTLGSNPYINNSSKPAFTISLENITEKEAEVTETELNFLNGKLEKILGAEIKEKNCEASSGRNTHVSSARSSQESTTTLSGKTSEVPANSQKESKVCPIQEYLFGSAVELSETTNKAKKEHRMSLKELFQRTKAPEEQMKKEENKSAAYIMKKMLTKKVPHVFRSSSVAFGQTANSSPAETKPNKIIRMFHRKVHPENPTSSKNQLQHLKNKKYKNISQDGVRKNHNQILPDGEIKTLPQNTIPDSSINSCKSQSDSQFTLSSALNENKEFWIKTDADYLVLEF